jgi:spore coat assembly protein SafA
MRFNEFKTLVPHSDSMGPGEEIVLPSHVIVKRGDTLFKIAEKLGISLAELIAANPQISNPDLIYPGDKIKIPSKTPAKPEIDRGRPTMKDDPRLKPSSPETPGVTSPPVRPGQEKSGKSAKKITFGRYEIENTEPASECFDFFKRKGLNDIQSAAFVGNFYEESKFNTKIVNKKENAWGIGQWRLDRYKGLTDFANNLKKKWHDFQLQLDYSWHELTKNGTYKKILPALNNNKDNLKECVRIIMDDYEVADSASYPRRLGFAESALRLFGTEQTDKPA